MAIHGPVPAKPVQPSFAGRFEFDDFDAIQIGGGASFLNANRVGVGFDMVLEGGSFNGYWIGGLQLLVSPEFHF